MENRYERILHLFLLGFFSYTILNFAVQQHHLSFQNTQKKMLPKISLEILKALHKVSMKTNKVILDWSDVLCTVRKNVKKAQVLDGQDVYIMCCLLKDYGLVRINIFFLYLPHS